jgi:hypothetical protein
VPVGWQNGRFVVPARLAAHGEVGKKEMVIDDEKISRGGFAPGVVEKAFIVVAAANTAAVVAFAGHFLPDRKARQDAQVRTAPLRGAMRPLENGFQFSALVGFDQVIAFLLNRFHLAQTDIVLPSFDQHRFELQIQGLLQHRQVFVHELFLQVDGVG